MNREISSIRDDRIADLGRRLRAAEAERDEALRKIDALNEAIAQLLTGAGRDQSDLVPLKTLVAKVCYERMRQWAAARDKIPARKIRGRWMIPRGYKLSA